MRALRIAHVILTIIFFLALVGSLTVSRRTRQNQQQEIDQITDANNSLRKTLGDLTIAITQREREIDRLIPCEAPEKRNSLRQMPQKRDLTQATKLEGSQVN
jgi:hypothetical protein